MCERAPTGRALGEEVSCCREAAILSETSIITGPKWPKAPRRSKNSKLQKHTEVIQIVSLQQVGHVGSGQLYGWPHDFVCSAGCSKRPNRNGYLLMGLLNASVREEAMELLPEVMELLAEPIFCHQSSHGAASEGVKENRATKLKKGEGTHWRSS